MIRSALMTLDQDESPALGSPLRAWAGIPWLARWILTASRAGVENFLVVGEQSLELAKSSLRERLSRAGVRVFWVHASQAGVLNQTIQSSGSPHDLWILGPWNTFIPKGVWQSLQEEGGRAGMILTDGKTSVAAAVRTDDLSTLFSSAETGASFLDHAARRLGSVLPVREFPDCRRVVTRSDIQEAERRLYQDLIKDTEGFMSRHVERKISFAITRLLVKTPITPNAVSLFNILLGVGSGFLLAVPERRIQVLGALLFLFTSILDGCDGEIARLKFMESRWGGWLDFLGDNIVHVAVFWGIAVGVWMTDGNPWARILGAFAVVGTIGSAVFVFLKTVQSREEAAAPFFTTVTAASSKSVSRLVQIDDFLTRRDFIYLVVALAAIGKLQWFLWMSAIGAPLFFVTLVVIHLKEPFLGEKTA
jgi:phosphatidylglycerophosphate synthase